MQKPQEPKDMPQEFYSSGSYTFYALWLRGQGREEEAAEVYHEAAVRQKSHQAHFGLGISRLNQGKLEEAVAELEAAIRIAPDWALAYEALGRALDKAGRYDEAVDKFKQGLNLSPNYYAICIHMGDAYKHKGDMQNAIRSYREAAAGYTESHPDGHVCLANALLEIGSVSEAVEILTPLVEQCPNWAAIHLSAGNALLAAGRVEEARSRWQRVLDIRRESDEDGLNDQETNADAQQAQMRLNSSIRL